MKMILRRNDMTSICCPMIGKRTTRTAKTKRVEFTIACLLIVTGLLLILFFQ